MKHLFIVNPIAGGRDATAEVTAQVERIFANRSDEYEIYVTKGPKDAPGKIMSEAKCGKHIRVYSCGGDGTFNECVCGAAELPNVAICPYPTGTGNDFCRMFGEEAALFRDLEALVDGTEHPLDLIDANGHWCANICSVGIDARVGTDVHSYTHLPFAKGMGAYIISAVVNILRGVNTNMYIKCGDYYSEGKHALCCVCNGRYYGGGFNPSKTARPDDGLLDFYIIHGVNLLTVASLVGKYAKGEGDKYPEHITHLQGTKIEIGFDEPNVVNIDGEGFHTDKVCVSLVPGAATLIAPRGMRFFDSAAAENGENLLSASI